MDVKLLTTLAIFLFVLVTSSHQQRNRDIDLTGLSYSNPDLSIFQAPPPTRPSTTTTTTTIAPETTTKKRGFFGGIKNFFSGKDKTVETTTTQATTTTTRTTPRTTSTTPRTQPTTTTTTTTKKPIVDDFPPLPTKQAPQPPPVPPRPQSPQRPSQDPAPPLPSRPGSPSVGPPVPTRPGSPQSPQKTSQDPFPPLPSRSSVGPSLPTRPGSPQTTPRSAQTQPTIRTPVNPWTATPPSANKPGAVSFIPTQPHGAATTRKPAVTYAPGDTASDAELLTLSESLFSRDINNPFKYVTVNYQGKTYSSAPPEQDEALHPLLSTDDRLYQMSTVDKMKALFNNYELDTLVNEYVTPLERKEENDFIDAILTTPVMRQAMNFLQQKGKVTADPQTHRELLKTIWFNLYSRGQGKIGSSGFEHVFLSELKNSTVIGLHNWLYFHEVEKTGDLNYKGYSKKIDFGNKGALVKVRFSFKNVNKPTNSLFIGTSPELEMALYTVCFEMRADDSCPMAYGGNRFNIVTHTFRYRGKNLIGSAYPEIQ